MFHGYDLFHGMSTPPQQHTMCHANQCTEAHEKMADFSVFALVDFGYDKTNYIKPMKTILRRRVSHVWVSSKNCMIKF